MTQWQLFRKMHQHAMTTKYLNSFVIKASKLGEPKRELGFRRAHVAASTDHRSGIYAQQTPHWCVKKPPCTYTLQCGMQELARAWRTAAKARRAEVQAQGRLSSGPAGALLSLPNVAKCGTCCSQGKSGPARAGSHTR
jgi:hypothetical protein